MNATTRAGPGTPASKQPSDRGVITAFVTVITLAVSMCAGLVLDGGRAVQAHVHAANLAGAAARAGANEIVGLRAGHPAIDPSRAHAAASAYLDAHGIGGHGIAATVLATPEAVTVTVVITRATVLAHLAGVPEVRASATRTAAPVWQQG